MAALRPEWFSKWQVSKIVHGHRQFPTLAKPTVHVENWVFVYHKELCTGVTSSFWERMMYSQKNGHVVSICEVYFCTHPHHPLPHTHCFLVAEYFTLYSHQPEFPENMAVSCLPWTRPNRPSRCSTFSWRNECGWFSLYFLLSSVWLTGKIVSICLKC